MPCNRSRADPEHLGKRAAFHQKALVETINYVAFAQCRHSMGDHKDGIFRSKTLHRLNDVRFGCIVERAGGLVQNQNGLSLVERAGNSDALPLAAGKPHSSFSDARPISVGKAHDEFVELG